MAGTAPYRAAHEHLRINRRLNLTFHASDDFLIQALPLTASAVIKQKTSQLDRWEAAPCYGNVTEQDAVE